MIAGRAAEASAGDDAGERDDRDPHNHRLSYEITHITPLWIGAASQSEGPSRSPFPRPTLRRLAVTIHTHPTSASLCPLPASQSCIASRPRRESREAPQTPRGSRLGLGATASVPLSRQTSRARQSIARTLRPRRGGFFHDESRALKHVAQVVEENGVVQSAATSATETAAQPRHTHVQELLSAVRTPAAPLSRISSVRKPTRRCGFDAPGRRAASSVSSRRSTWAQAMDVTEVR